LFSMSALSFRVEICKYCLSWQPVIELKFIAYPSEVLIQICDDGNCIGIFSLFHSAHIEFFFEGTMNRPSKNGQ